MPRGGRTAGSGLRAHLREDWPLGGGGGCACGTWELLAGDGTLTKAVTRAATVTTLDP